jgi:TolB protein
VGGQYDIFWADLEDLNWTNITNSEFYECVPNWTPDGLRLVYEANSHELYGGHRIFSVLLNGQEPIQLLSIGSLGDEGQIALSPDGSRLAFNHRDDNGFYQLFIADLDGSNRVQLTDLPAHNFGPSFSPDGKWLVFHRQTDPYSVTNQYDDSRNHIVIMNIETREDSTIISGNNGNENFASPTWAPFGQWIAFTSNVGGSYDIYIIRADGSGLTRVTSSPGNESHPKWRVYYSP